MNMQKCTEKSLLSWTHLPNVVPTEIRCRPVLNWANCLFAENISDSSTNYNSFLNPLTANKLYC